MLLGIGYSFDSSLPGYKTNNKRDARVKNFTDNVYEKYVDKEASGRFGVEDHILYTIYLQALTSKCSLKNLGPVADISNATYKEWVNDGHTVNGDGKQTEYKKVKLYVAPTGEEGQKSGAIDHGISYTKATYDDSDGKSTTQAVQLWGHHNYQQFKKSCLEMTNEIGALATAYARWAKDNPDAAITDTIPGGGEVTCGDSSDCEADDTTTCIPEGVGWIVCPIVTFSAKMVDALYGWISSYLRVQPLNVDTTASNNTTYKAWEAMRNIANVAFVIAFLIIIFSQLSSIGVSNYGVKKMIPRLIIAAILVNLSYWIAAIAVDVSNILGNNIYNVLKGFNVGDVDIETNGWEALSVWLLSGGTVTAGIVAGKALIAAAGAGAVSASGVAMLAIYALIPIVIAVVLALILAFVILALRQALIIIMIVLSPLAFVAFLLPNTEKFFKMWYKSLTTLLVFYPLFSVLFGGSWVAGMIIIGAAGGQGDDSPAVAVTVLLGMAVTIIPLFLTPLLIKFSSGIMGQAASAMNGKFKSNPLSRAMKGLRNRKAGLAMGEALGRESRNPFNRAYRGIQNNRQADEKRKDNIGSSNKASYLETDRSGRLDAQGKALGERIKTAEAHHEEAHERNVLTNPDLMRLRRAQDASKRATANYSAQQTENIERNLSPESLAHDQVRANAELRTKGLQEDQKLAIERAQQANPELRGERLRQAATAKELTQLEKDRQRIVSQAGNAEGAAALAAQGYDPGVISRIQDANNATADTDLHIAHNEAQNTAETDVRQGADADLTRVKLSTEAAKQVSTDQAKQFEDIVGDTKTTEGRASLESQGLISTATATSFANTQRSIADSEVFIARSNAEAGAEVAQAQQGDMDIQNAKLATEAAQQTKSSVDKTFEEVTANAKTIAGGQELIDQGYDANIIDSIQGSKDSIADSEARTAFANSESGLETTLRQNSDPALRDVKLSTAASQRDQKSEDAKFEQVVTEATSAAGGAALVEQGYDADTIGRLQDSQFDSSVTTAATAAAQRVAQEEFTAAVMADGLIDNGGAFDGDPAGQPGDTRRTITEAMGGIDGNGRALATAQAIETQRRARESSVAAFSVQQKNAGTPSNQLAQLIRGVDPTGQGRPISAEERDAAGRGITESGDIDQIKPYLEYLSTALSNTTDPTEVTTIQDLQKAAAERLSNSPGKPMGIGAPEIAAMREGRYQVAVPDPATLTPQQASILTTTDNIQTFNTITSKGVAPQKWATIDKNDIRTITELVSSGAVPADQLEALKKSLIVAKDDPRISNLIQEREARLLTELSNQINTMLPAQAEPEFVSPIQTARGQQDIANALRDANDNQQQ